MAGLELLSGRLEGTVDIRGTGWIVHGFVRLLGPGLGAMNHYGSAWAKHWNAEDSD